MLHHFYTLLIGILIKTEYTAVQGNPDGPFLTQVICKTLSPLEHISKSKNNGTNLEYEINTQRDWFYLNETINITIGSKTNPTFKGIMLQVVDKFEQAAGRFATPSKDSGFKIFPCHDILNSFSENSTISHSNPKHKQTTTFEWTSSFPICNGPEYYIRATIVKEFALFQTGITKKVSCIPVPAALTLKDQNPSAIIEETVQHKCDFTNVTSVPENKYKTSFELCNLNGWNNTGWWCNEGETITQHTGPNSAAEGTFYMFFETSYPKRPGNQVYLETASDLRGCFCLKFKHSHNVDSKQRHRLKVTLGSKIYYDVIDKFEGWKDISVQFDVEDYSKVIIEGTKGSNVRGDMAIDDVRIIEGNCF